MSLPKPYYEEEGITIYHADCRAILPHLPKVDLVLTDPPYNGVIDERWDNQWETDKDFLAWVSDVVAMLDGAITDSGTLYWFASPQMASRVEVTISERFNVIAHAIWNKGMARQGAAGSGVDISALRTYWASTTERVIVAEKRLNALFLTADKQAQEKCGYWTACERAKASVFGDYLKEEFYRAGVSNRQIAALFPSKTGRPTGCVSNWLLGLNVPTATQYKTMRDFLNGLNGEEYLRKDYEEMRKDYEEMRKDYEEMRKDYEEMRRPFFLDANDQWSQVWEFPIERERAHPTQKPLPLIQQIVKVSSRATSTILDPFMGSGTTLRAAKDLGRKAIGIEIEERYCEIAVKRLAQEVLPL